MLWIEARDFNPERKLRGSAESKKKFGSQCNETQCEVLSAVRWFFVLLFRKRLSLVLC